MKILCVADDESKKYYDYFHPGCLDEFDLIIACGDLHKHYLEFLVTMAHCPLIYVYGNHDDRLSKDPPEGCICIEDDIFVYKGIRFMGLGGSFRYKKEGINMYTERAMKRRIQKLFFKILKNRGFDVLVTHAPVRHINDFENMSHRGFECFELLMNRYEPLYLVHGHVHMNYGMKIPRTTVHNNTTIINAYENYVIEIPDDYVPKQR